MAQARCLAGSGVPPIPYANHLQCGLQTANQSDIESCCESDVEVFDTCYMYCKPKTDFGKFVTCVSGGSNSSGTLRTDAFCQRGLYGDSTESIAGLSASGATSAKRPSMAAILTVALLAMLLLVVPASATPTDNTVAARSDQQCHIKINDAFNTTSARSINTTGIHDCPNDAGTFCTFAAHAFTGFLEMNRTLNGKSAADVKWNFFFEELGRATTPQRLFPATSSLDVHYQWVALPGTSTSLGFTQVLVSLLDVPLLLTGADKVFSIA